jgi:pimeloyl-ACP methyl ester carboxylesterase
MNATAITATVETTHMVVSQDGARIGYLTMGSGPSVVVIPGALSVAADYLSFARALAEQFTVHIIERRGRGLSSPQGAAYSVVTECEDVRAVQEATGATLLVGHSFGGLVALEATLNNHAFTKIAVYEPGVSINGAIPMDWIPAYEKKLSEKKNFAAFVEFSRGTGPDRARNTPRWLMKLLLLLLLRSHERQQMLGLLPENLREHGEVARLAGSYENYRHITADVLLMCGGKTRSAWVDTAMEHLAAVLPHAEMRVFPALDHFGINKKAPREVATAVGDFFST